MASLIGALCAVGFTPPSNLPSPQSPLGTPPAASPIMMPPSPFPAVPKAYRVPDQTDIDWIEGNDPLYRHRLTYLGQEIDDLVINQIIAMMLFLDAEDETKPIHLYVNSPGGSVIAGLALYDTMQHIGSEVLTVNTGMAASMVRRRPLQPHGASRCRIASFGSPPRLFFLLATPAKENR